MLAVTDREPGEREGATLTSRFSVRARRSVTTVASRGKIARLALSLLAVALLFGAVSAFAAGNTRSQRTSSLITNARCSRNAGVGTINYVSAFGYDASAGIIDVYMAQKLGYFKDLCLHVALNAAAFNGQQLVSSGAAQVTGIGSAADALLSKASGANLTSVATYGDTDPHVILTNENFPTLKSLEGGTLGYFINMTPAAVAMLVKAGVDITKIHLIALTNYDPTIVTRGQIDGLVGYASNQGVELKTAGQPFHEFLPSQYGIKGTYNIMQFNGTFLEQHRAVSADFMRADLKALAYCLVHKKQCVTYLSQLAAANNQGNAFPLAHQMATWNYESKFVTSDKVGGYGVQTVKEWQPEYNEVKQYGTQAGLTSSETVPTIQQTMDPSLVAGLYHGKTLIWPGK